MSNLLLQMIRFGTFGRESLKKVAKKKTKENRLTWEMSPVFDGPICR